MFNRQARDWLARTATPPLSLRRVRLGYGANPVLHDLDLDIPEGRMTVIVGPNGCGKSTLLKAMARLLPVTAGEVRLEGQPLHGLPTRHVAQRLALLPQAPSLPEGLSVRDLVAQGRFPHQGWLGRPHPGDQAAIDRALAQTGLAALADRPVAALSGGQRQRVWIAMVLAQETPLILLDEPTAWLDLRVQLDLMACLHRLTREAGRTLVLVLHELNLAAAYADHMVMLREGRIMAEGAPDAVMTPALLHRVFGLEASVIADPLTGRPVCLPVAAA